MDRLREQLHEMLAPLANGDLVRTELAKLASAYPFNEYEYLIAQLLGGGALSLQEYARLRSEYVARNKNRALFELGPTALGTTWAQKHVMELAPAAQTAGTSKHDLQLDEIRVELKTSRAVDKSSKRPLVEKALATHSDKPFLMNFQQTKADLFDRDRLDRRLARSYSLLGALGGRGGRPEAFLRQTTPWQPR